MTPPHRLPAQRWQALWHRLGAAGDGDQALALLQAHYSEPHRAYHNFAHIVACLHEFDFVRSLIQKPDAVEMALWFHDAIYDPKAGDNEERSAALFGTAARAARLNHWFIRRVDALIRATQHKKRPSLGDARFMVDLDLSILGKSPAKFSTYERQIRREYAWVPSRAYVAGRSAILQNFLSRKTIYATEFFRRRYEARARANLGRSLVQLSRRRGN